MKQRVTGSFGAGRVLGAVALSLVACTARIDEPADPPRGWPTSAGASSLGSGGAYSTSAGATSATQAGGGPTASASGGTPAAAGSAATSPPGGSATVSDAGTIFSNPPSFAPAPGQLRRLTRTQCRNALKDVFGYEVDLDRLDADSWSGNFASIGAAVVVTSDQGAEQYNAAIESAVDAVFSDATKRSPFVGCTPNGASNDACLRGFIQKLGRRAWRRPLEAAELDRFGALAANAGTTLGDAVEGARWATVALFESPHFIYRPELGAPAANGALRFSGYELAGRLSFLIWNSLPDQTLLDQAASGMLSSAAGIRTAATRMLDMKAGRESIGNFVEEYLRLDRLASQSKDPSLFPEYGPSLQAAMARDMRDTWASLVFDDRARASDLFTTTKVVVNAELAKLYGLDATGLTATTFETRALPVNGPRAGILSKAALLSEFANQQSGSPTLRGRFIRESLMCLAVPSPPPGVNTAAVDQPSDTPMTKRQKLELHRSAPACSGCHSLMDPLGLPLESFDAIGRFRTLDNGLPIDPTSTFDGQPVADARELGVAASQSVAIAQCLVRKYYAYAVGHPERQEDGSVLNTLATAFKASGFDLRELIVAIVTHEAFATAAPQP